MAEFQPKTEYGIRAEEYPYHGAKLHGHNSYGALEFNAAAAEYPALAQACSKKKKRKTIPHMAAAVMAVAAVAVSAAAVAPEAASVQPERPAISASAETPGQTGPTLPEPTVPETSLPAAVHAHSYTSEVLQAATCSEPGTVQYTCTCGDTYTEAIPTTDHTPEVVPAVEATCQEPGLTEGSKCSVCGEVLVEQEEVPQLEHTPEIVWGFAATCTHWGLTNGTKCTVCGEILTPQKTIPETNHRAVNVAGKDATCTSTGLTSGRQCADCGAIISGMKTIPMRSHDWKTEDYETDFCTRCGARRPHETEPWVDPTEELEPTEPIAGDPDKG